MTPIQTKVPNDLNCPARDRSETTMDSDIILKYWCTTTGAKLLMVTSTCMYRSCKETRQGLVKPLNSLPIKGSCRLAMTTATGFHT